MIYIAGAYLGESLVMRVFAYVLPTFRLRGAYAQGAPLFSNFGYANFEA